MYHGMIEAGDTVVCVNAGKLYRQLTDGKMYHVRSIYSLDRIVIRDNLAYHGRYRSNRFIKINQNSDAIVFYALRIAK